MSEGQSQCSVASSVQHRQEAEVAAAEERERAAAEIAATAARAMMAELAAERAEVEAAAVVDAARAAAAELKALRASSTDSSVSTDDDRDNELRRRDSPSPDRYHGHHGIQAIVRDVGPGGGGLPSPRPTTSSGPR
jgi:hypothetical protein